MHCRLVTSDSGYEGLPAVVNEMFSALHPASLNPGPSPHPYLRARNNGARANASYAPMSRTNFALAAQAACRNAMSVPVET